MIRTGSALAQRSAPPKLDEGRRTKDEGQHHQGFKVACLEEIAFRNGWMDEEQLKAAAAALGGTAYAKYLLSLVPENGLKQ